MTEYSSDGYADEVGDGDEVRDGDEVGDGDENGAEPTGNREPDDAEGLTYAEAGVDIAASESATAALVGAAGEFQGDYAGLVEVGDRYLALATDGVGTKLLVAEAVEDYSTVGIDCVAMNVNDLVAAGVEPVAFVDYLAVETPDDETAAAIGEGLRRGADRADVALLGGETAVMPEVVRGLDVAGTAAGLAPTDAPFPGEAAVGDALVGWPSSGIHSNGLTLAREAVTGNHDYEDPFPPAPDRTIGAELLTPTRIYTDLLEGLRTYEARAAAHVTGGGWTNLARMGAHRYEIDEPCEPQPIFAFVQEAGDVSDEELHRTFNVGTGFVAAVLPSAAPPLVDEYQDARRIGTVRESRDGAVVAVRGLELRD
jgi:phosphoribosylformylglycinamidine cyclo-ligase